MAWIELLWLWCRPAATVPIRPLAWEPPRAASAALEKGKKKKKKRIGHLPREPCEVGYKVIGPLPHRGAHSNLAGMLLAAQPSTRPGGQNALTWPLPPGQASN